jgi:hypothetical protein
MGLHIHPDPTSAAKELQENWRQCCRDDEAGCYQVPPEFQERWWPSEDSNRLSPGGLGSPRLYIQSGALQDMAFHPAPSPRLANRLS